MFIFGPRSYLIFHVSLALCILLAPSYVTLAGTRISIFTSYTCHTIFIISFIYFTKSDNSKSLLISSAFLGLGTALAFVAQGKFLVENKRPEAIHKYIINFWFSIEVFRILLSKIRYDIELKLYNAENNFENIVNGVNVFIVIFSFSLFIFIKEKTTNDYTSGGVECIPNEKFVTNNEVQEEQQQQQQQRNRGPIFHLWNPLKNIFLLTISWKMVAIYFIATFAGLLSSAENVIYNVDNVISSESTLIIGKICGVLFYSICIYKKASSLNITYVGYVILFIFVSINSAANDVQISSKSELLVRIFAFLFYSLIILNYNFILV